MDLRTLIPDPDSLSAPLGGVVGDGASGLSGLAGQVEGLDFAASAGTLGTTVNASLQAVLPASGSGPFDGAVGALGTLTAQIDAVPTDLLSGIEQPLADLDRTLGELPTLLEPLTAVAGAVQAARSGDLGPVVSLAADALREVAERAAGGDFAEFADWTAYLQELADAIRPVVDAGGTPDDLRDALLALALDRARETILGLAPDLSAVLDDVSPVVDDLLPDVPGLGITALRDQIGGALAGLRTDAGVAGTDLGVPIALYRSRLTTLLDTLRLAFAEVESRGDHPLLTPGATLDLASAEVDRVLAMEVSDFSNVQERVEAFYTDIEAALDVVDLSAVTGEVTGFFDTVTGALGTLDVAALAARLDTLSAEVDTLVTRFETVITSLTARIQQWLDELAGVLDEALGTLGTFDAQGNFTFFFQGELDGLFTRLDHLISGDPERPDAFSIRGALEEMQAGLVEFIEQVEQTLTSLAGELEAAKDQLAGGLEEVRTAIESVDPAAVMDEAKTALERAFQEIGDLELDPLVDPIIADLEDARDALSQIDVSELNDLLRAALREVLDAISTSDFDRQLTRPLVREFDELLDGPREVLATFADKFNELVDRLEAISPAALLAPVQAELDRVTGGLDVDLEKLLEPPLEQALAGVRRELDRLNPQALLAPVQSVFDQLGGAVNALEPARLLAPAERGIDALADAVRGLDLDAPLADVNALFGDIDRFLDEIDPVRLLAPLNEPFVAARTTLDGLRPSVLLAPLTDIMDQIGDLTSAVPESVADQARGLFDEAMARIDGLDPGAVFATVGTAVGGLRDRVDAVGVPALLHALQGEYATTLAAVRVADQRDGTAFALELTTLEPTRVFGPLVATLDRITGALRGVLDSLDPSGIEARYSDARARIEELLPRAIRDDITASQIQTLLALTDPARLIDRLDATYQRIVDQVLAISPELLIAPLAVAHQTVRDAVALVDVGALTARIEDLIERIAGVVDGLSLEALAAPILDGVDRLKSVVQALDPAPIIGAIGERFDDLVNLFDEISVRALVRALQSSWDEIAERVRSLLDLEVLLEPLIAILEQIQELLGGIDMGELVAVIDGKIDKLRDELEEALNRTGDAFKAMLAAVPV